MDSRWGPSVKYAVITIPVFLLMASVLAAENQKQQKQVPIAEVFKEQCAACHGETLQGSGQGPALVGEQLKHGDTVKDLNRSIKKGYQSTGMPAWASILSTAKIKSLSLYIITQRQNAKVNHSKKNNVPVKMPDGVIKTEQHGFEIETLAAGLHPRPYSIAPLPDGRILLSEKRRGLSIISKDGAQSKLVQGLPQIFDDLYAGVDANNPLHTVEGHIYDFTLDLGVGWMHEVAIHPDYEKNGWIYIQYGDRCSTCNKLSRDTSLPVSMNRLIRGRIKEGVWVDEQTLWKADIETYTQEKDMLAGGRISFDNQGHVFISVGAKVVSHLGGQDLNLPYGKIHRLHDDGRIPKDNPFYNTPNALKSIWTYGHRNPQGLEFNRESKQLWGTEHGPRGGDEINLLLPGGNFGWPLYSKGVNYDGTPVDNGSALGITWSLDDIEQPVVDLTPSPAISSFVFYQGNEFPNWRDSIIAGSLKAQELYRVVIKDNKAVHKELLIKGIGRIRDVEIGFDGLLYLLIENGKEGQIVRLVNTEGDLSPKNQAMTNVEFPMQ